MKKWFVLSLVVILLSAASSWATLKTVLLATTTSTQDSGLPDVLVPLFERESGYTVKTILPEGGSKLLNIYHVIELNQAKWSKVNTQEGKAFADYIVAKRTQETIARFGAEKVGVSLFLPDAGKNPQLLGL